MLYKIFKFLIKTNIAGRCNKVTYIGERGENKIRFARNGSSLKIVGNNNKINFYKNTKSKRLPKGLNLNINGNNNTIIIYEPNFENTTIDIYGNNCTFILKKQHVQKVKSAFFGLGHGAAIYIDEGCELGNGGLHVVVNGDWKEKHKLQIGKNVRIAKDCIIRTSDGHTLCDEEGVPFSGPQDVILEDNVWVMSRVTILKGTHIASGSAVAANSLVNKKFSQNNILIAGTPAKIIKENIKWVVDYYGIYMQKNEKILKQKGII